MRSYPNQQLNKIVQENFRILSQYCIILESEGYWEHPYSVLNRPILDFLSSYIQAMMVHLARYMKRGEPELLQLIERAVPFNPLQVTSSGISAETAERAEHLVLAPPILLQLCSLRDVEKHSSLTGLFFDALLNILLSEAAVNNRQEASVTTYIKEYYSRIHVFIESANSYGACVNEKYLFRKICMGELIENTSQLKAAGEDFILYKKEAFNLEEPVVVPEETKNEADEISEDEPEYGRYEEPEDEPEYGRYEEPEDEPEYGRYEEPEYGKYEEPEDEPEYGKYEEPEDEPEYGKYEEPEDEPGYGKYEEPEDEPEYGRYEESVDEPESGEQRRQENEKSAEAGRVCRLDDGAENEAKNKEAKKEENKREAVTFQSAKLDLLLRELNELVGLSGVKEEIYSLINLIRVRKLRESYQLPDMPMSYHMVFTGNPGTGKTTIARLIGDIYKELGIVSRGNLIETDRAGLVAGYVGQTAIKVSEVVEKAKGGILFIDEAYSLTNSLSPNDFGSEAVDTLVKLMEDYRDDFIVIVAGYTEEMKHFLEVNTGLMSRFNKFLDFPDYSSEELLLIIQRLAEKSGFTMNNELCQAISEHLEGMTREEKDNFGNARGVRNLFEKLVTAQANRVVQLTAPTREQLLELTLVDWEQMR